MTQLLAGPTTTLMGFSFLLQALTRVWCWGAPGRSVMHLSRHHVVNWCHIGTGMHLLGPAQLSDDRRILMENFCTAVLFYDSSHLIYELRLRLSHPSVQLPRKTMHKPVECNSLHNLSRCLLLRFQPILKWVHQIIKLCTGRLSLLKLSATNLAHPQSNSHPQPG